MSETRPVQSEARSPHRSVSWGRDVPFRNPHFTGREKELSALRDRLKPGTPAIVGQPAQPLFGLGGVGKTEIATEYAHRFADDYDLVWWVRAEQEDSILDAFIGLGKRMRLPEFRVEERDYSADLVIDALNRGEPFGKWLLIFDNARNQESIAKYIPHGRGHVIITSRDSHWFAALQVDGVEVAEFDTDETIAYLRKRVPALALAEPPEDADEKAIVDVKRENQRRRREASELAKELANLPLATEHAAAYLAETGLSVKDYLELFRRNAHLLLADDVDIRYPGAVGATWSVSRGTISPEADVLFQLLAFFSPEPISQELLLAKPQQLPALPGLLGSVLGESQAREYRRASRQLSRFSLAKVDGVRNVIQIHRVVQAVTQSRLEQEDPGAAKEFRDAAHALLAASDPGVPDNEAFDSIYERSRQHIVPSGAIESENPQMRSLIVNQVRRHHRRGGYRESLNLGDLALKRWREKFGYDDPHTLALALEVGIARRDNGNWRAAADLNSDTLERLRRNYDEDDPTYLNCARSHGIDLRFLGQYHDALDHELRLLPVCEQVFGPDHIQTLNVRNNVAISLRCLGHIDEALHYDRETLRQRERTLGPTDNLTLTSKFAIARDFRFLGRYEEALDLIREVNDTLDDKKEPWYLFRLLMAADLGVSLRRSGYYRDAAREAETVFERHVALVGHDHRRSLQVAMNLINDRRLVDDLSGAQELGDETVRRCERIIGSDHPNTNAARANLALVLRVRGNPRDAVKLNDEARAGFESAFGIEHLSTITVLVNLASDYASLGDVPSARRLSEQAFELSRRVRGAEHPATLATAANLTIDRRADGDEEGSGDLLRQTLTIYDNTLTAEHPEARLAAQGGRINLNIEPVAD